MPDVVSSFLLVRSWGQSEPNGACRCAIKYATLLATGRYITPNELPEELTADPISAPVNIQLKNESHECEMIKRALQEAGNNKTRAAQLLGIDRKTLYNKLKAYGIAWSFYKIGGLGSIK